MQDPLIILSVALTRSHLFIHLSLSAQSPEKNSGILTAIKLTDIPCVKTIFCAQALPAR